MGKSILQNVVVFAIGILLGLVLFFICYKIGYDVGIDDDTHLKEAEQQVLLPLKNSVQSLINLLGHGGSSNNSISSSINYCEDERRVLLSKDDACAANVNAYKIN